MTIPPHVLADLPVHKSPGVTAWYQPANTRADLPRTPGGQRFQATDALMLSGQIQGALLDAGEDMVREGQATAAEEGVVDTGEYLGSFDSRRGEIVEISDGTYANPRVSVDVGNTSEHAVIVEYGNSQAGPGHHVLGKVAAKFDNPKGA